MKSIRERQEMLDSIAENPVMKSIRERQEMLDSIAENPVMKRFRDQEDVVRSLSGGPAGQVFHEQQNWFGTLMEIPTVAALRAEDSEPAGTIDPFLGEIQKFQTDLYADVAEIAARAPDDTVLPGEATADPADRVAMWFGATTAELLIWEMEGLLRKIEVVAASLEVVSKAADTELPQLLTALILMFFTAAELMLYLAKGRPKA